MSLTSNFEMAWKPVEQSVRATLLREQQERNTVTLACANRAWEQEKWNWSDTAKIQFSFLRELEKKRPDYAKTFRDKISKFAFQEVQLPTLPNPVPYVLGAAGTAVAGGALGWFLPATSFLPKLIGRIPTITAGCVILGGLGGGIMKELWDSQAGTVLENSAELYMTQLEPLHRTLRELCQKADSCK